MRTFFTRMWIKLFLIKILSTNLALRKPSGLFPTQTLSVGSAQLGRVVERQRQPACGPSCRQCLPFLRFQMLEFWQTFIRSCFQSHICECFHFRRCSFKEDQDSSVGIATRYGLDGPGIESRWGWDFPHQFRPALGPTQPPIQWVTGPSQG